MSNTIPLHLRTIDHIVGNNLGHVRNFHSQKTSSVNQERLHEIQGEVIERLDSYLTKQGIDNQGALNVLQALKDYDWTTRDGYIAFRKVHDEYQIANGGAIFPLF